MHWGSFAMKAFIAGVIVIGFFGPYMISIILGGICLALWACTRNGDHTPGHDY